VKITDRECCSLTFEFEPTPVMKHLTSIYRYPVKSSMPISLQESVVEKRGLKFDRLWCIFDKNEQALTAREYPQILDIEE